MKLFVAVLFTLCCYAAAQQLLPQSAMKKLFKYQVYNYPGAGDAHTCAYLSLKANAYTQTRQHDAHLECNCVRRIDDCQGNRLEVTRKCCPGFKAFRYEADGRLTCMERVLPRSTFKGALDSMNAKAFSTALFDSAYGAYFNDSSSTYTVFATRDSDGMSTTGLTRRQASASDYSSATYIHVAKGRVYTQSLSQESSIATLHKTGQANSNIKFSRYSNGIMCVECSLIKEANYEATNGVVHVIDTPFFKSAGSKTLAATLQADYGYFWSSLSAEIKAQLSGSLCDGWYTVFVPSQAQWSGANAVTAANHIIKGLWCTHGLVSQSSANLATLAGDVLQLGCTGADRGQVAVTSNGRSAIIDSTERARTFDRMATNGVIHVINAKLEPRQGMNFRYAVQLDEVEAGEPRNSLFYEFSSCGIEFEATKKYIVLMPTLQAMTKFYKYRSSQKDSKQYLRSQETRCQFLRYHILISEDGMTDLDRVMHLQKAYKTLLGDEIKISDFLVSAGQKITPHFMYAKTVSSRAFSNGHIYQIDRVLLPPTANRWTSVVSAGRGLTNAIKRSLDARMRNLERMEAAAPADSQCTHFVPPQADLEESALKLHSARYTLWSNYLRNGDTLELPPCSPGGRRLLLRRGSRKSFTLSFVDSNQQIAVQAANILRPSGMLWFIERALA